jgi:acetyl-CoA carboxylase carboxyltransferase component
MSTTEKLLEVVGTITKGGAEKYHAKNRETGKLFARDRLALLLDDGSFVEEGRLANVLDGELPADGVVTGLGRVEGRAVAVMANDSTVKAGSWGARTVEKILRIQEEAAGCVARCSTWSTRPAPASPTRSTCSRAAAVPGASSTMRCICRASCRRSALLFGPSAAGGAYIPAFCDLVIMVDKNASMYLGSPRMAEMVIGEKVTLEEMGGAKHALRASRAAATSWPRTRTRPSSVAKAVPRLLPGRTAPSEPPVAAPRAPRPSRPEGIDEIMPARPEQALRHARAHRANSSTRGSWFEVKKLFARSS